MQLDDFLCWLMKTANLGGFKHGLFINQYWDDWDGWLKPLYVLVSDNDGF